jgi:metal-sulfur cluster biosynthetic enzyme
MNGSGDAQMAAIPPEDVAPAPADAPVPEAPAASSEGDADLTADTVREALKAVIDPELGINIVDLGLVYDVAVSEGNVAITYSLTTMGCPIGPLIEAQMGAVLAPLPGFAEVQTEMVFRPPWSPEMMSEEAKAALGYF